VAEPCSVPRGSYCTRCRAFILPEDLAQFLVNDFLCNSCAFITDSEVAQQTIASERQPTVRAEVQA
jgi:hypothetical protein